MWRPKRARQAYIIPYKGFSTAAVGFEKNIEVVFNLVGICLLFGVAIQFHGFAIHIFGPLVITLGIGFGFGHVTKVETHMPKDLRQIIISGSATVLSQLKSAKLSRAI